MTQPHYTRTPTSSNDTPMADADAGNSSELLVWPWTGVIATITADADATSTLASHAQHHFAGVPTTMLQGEAARANRRCHLLPLHFGTSWSGLRDAMSLAFRFAGAGRLEWQRGDDAGSVGRVFGWAAAEEDLRGSGAVGRFLREAGARARSVEDVQKDEARHADALAAARDEYERREKFLDAQREEMLRLLREMEQENSWLLGELKEVEAIADHELPELIRGVDDEENEKLRAELGEIRAEIQLRVDRIQELKGCRTELELHCSKVEELVIEINSLETEEREAKARDHVQTLREKHKEEMEAINAKAAQLEKQLERMEAQVSATCLLDMKLKAGGKNLSDEACRHLYKLMAIWKECQEQERDRYRNAHVDLAKRDRLNSDELQETRQELVKCLESMAIGGHADIGIRRMGQLDEEPFYHACRSKYSGDDDDPEGKAARLVSVWQEELKNAFWNPFTATLVDGEEKVSPFSQCSVVKDWFRGDDFQDVVDEDDPKLRQLWTEYGDDTCNAVKNALIELNEYNPKGRALELWGRAEGYSGRGA